MIASRAPAPGGQFTAVIAEDEAVLRADLAAHLARLWPELQVVGVAKDGVDALALFDLHRPDIMFLDIQMPGLGGLDVARQVAGQCHIVFVTAYDSFAVTAFEQGAVDYILKPCDAGRLARTLGRLRERLRSPPSALDTILRDFAHSVKPAEYLRWITASSGKEIEMILISDVCYFQAEAKYTTVCTRARDTLIRRSIKELGAQIDPNQFWPIRRGTLVNVEQIESVSRGIAGSMSLKLRSRPERLKISPAHRHRFRLM